MGKKKTGSAIPAKLPELTPDVDTLPATVSNTVIRLIVQPAEMFAWLIHPITVDDFFTNYWEKKPLHISRDNANYYGSLFTRSHLLHKLKEDGLSLGQEIKAMRFNTKTQQREDVAEEEDEDGPTMVGLNEALKMWQEGYTFQVIQPQHYRNNMWRLLAALEGSFGSLWGANAYLTPGGTQGLAPHWDDVEVFVMQIEGEKEWTLIENDEDNELDPQCSGDLEIEDLADAEPIFKGTVKQGDLLYFPRGTIHYATCAKGEAKDTFSNHITISTYQGQSYADLINAMFSSALEKAVTTDVAFRAGLPVGYGRLFGAMYRTQMLDGGAGTVQSTKLNFEGAGDDEEHPIDRSRAIKPTGQFGLTYPTDNSAQVRAEKAGEVRKVLANLFHRLAEHFDIDETVDELQEDFQTGRLPPFNAVMAQRDATYQDIIKRQNDLGEQMAKFQAMAMKKKGIAGKGGKEPQLPPAMLAQVDQLEAEMDEFNSAVVTFGPCPKAAEITKVRLANPEAIRVGTVADECSGEKMMILHNAFKNDRRLHMAANHNGEDGHDEEGEFSDSEMGHDEPKAKSAPPAAGGCKSTSCHDSHCKDNTCDDEEDSESEHDDEHDSDEEGGMMCGHLPEGCVRLDNSKNGSELNAIRLMLEHGEEYVDVAALPFSDEGKARSFLQRLWLQGIVESKRIDP